MTQPDHPGAAGRSAGHDDGTAGPHQGPAHPGGQASAEPGGFDEYDHAPTHFDHGEWAAPTAGESAEGGSATAGGAPSVGAQGESRGIPVVSDGTATEGDGVEFAADHPTFEALADTVIHPDTALAAERLEDLRRLQAEYVNYKKRVDRDRALAREQGISHVLESMLPVLDEIHLARSHGDLTDGPAATIVDKLDGVLGKLGIERYGAAGDEFDPMHHEALMHTEADLPEGAVTTTVVQVLQPGYRLGERVVRPARVAVADPR